MDDTNVPPETPIRETRHHTRTYLEVWGLLMTFTGLSVAASAIHFGKLSVIICLAIAAFKATIVFLYFMHLRWEKRLLLKLLVPGTLILLTIFIGLTYLDVATR
jgi:cytochrome c oxidase subunit 4